MLRKLTDSCKNRFWQKKTQEEAYQLRILYGNGLHRLYYTTFGICYLLPADPSPHLSQITW